VTARLAAIVMIAAIAAGVLATTGWSAPRRVTSGAPRPDRAAAAETAGPQDAAILGELASFDDAEIAAGTYGATRATDPRVVRYAQGLVVMHQRHLAQVRAVALLLHLSPTTQPDSATRDVTTRVDALGALRRGPRFDSVFVSSAILVYRHAIGRALGMTTVAQSDSLRRLVERTVPLYHRSLDSALALRH